MIQQDDSWFCSAHVLHERDINASLCEQKRFNNERGAYSAALNASKLKLVSEAISAHVLPLPALNKTHRSSEGNSIVPLS